MRRLDMLQCAFILLQLHIALSYHDPPRLLHVNTSDGLLEGLIREDNVGAFLGVPYASPPVGSKRWLPPTQVTPWTGVKRAHTVSKGCIRSSTWYTLNPHMDENCLFLNIWLPAQRPDPVKLLPVMFWVFGGGYYTGSGDSLQTRGNQIVKVHGDVIVITHNYRLGVMGWLASEVLRRHTFDRVGANYTGNMGFLDQVMALKWVQRNIEAFGGDPNNVLLFGESAGAGSIAAHLTSVQSQGLFHKAILQSGGFNEWNVMSLTHAEHNFAALLRTIKTQRQRHPVLWIHKYKCRRGMTDEACLLRGKIDAHRLVYLAENNIYNHLPNASDWDGMQQCQWGPVADGMLLSEHPFKYLLRNSGAFAVPVIIGMNKDDGTEFIDGCRNGDTWAGKTTCKLSVKLYNHLYRYFSDARQVNDPHCFPDRLYRKWIAANWGNESVANLTQLYSMTSGLYSTNFWAAETLVGDYIMACSQLKASSLISMKAASYQYYFTRIPTLEPFGKKPVKKHITDGFGACHGCEIPFVFVRTDSLEYGVTGAGEVELAMHMSSYWTNFAWTGDPNEPGNRSSPTALEGVPAHWPKVFPGQESAIEFNATQDAALIHARASHPRKEACASFWEPFFHRSGWYLPDAPLQGPSWMRYDAQKLDRSQLVDDAPWKVCPKLEGAAPTVATMFV